jgi:hypothetical protein
MYGNTGQQLKKCASVVCRCNWHSVFCLPYYYKSGNNLFKDPCGTDDLFAMDSGTHGLKMACPNCPLMNGNQQFLLSLSNYFKYLLCKQHFHTAVCLSHSKLKWPIINEYSHLQRK